MSQTGYTPISLYYSATAAAAPTAGNLVAGELALNTNDGKLFYKDSGGVVQILATKGSAVVGGADTQVQYNSSGSLAGSANLTFNGTTLTAAGLSGPHNGTVGATTPSTGAFTTLSASSTVSGSGFSTYLASPPAIGGTAAAAGSFTTLSASSTVTLSGGTANGVAFLNASKQLTTGSALTFDGTNLALTSSGFANDVGGSQGILRVTSTNNTANNVLATFASTSTANNQLNVISATTGVIGLQSHLWSTGANTTFALNPNGGIVLVGTSTASGSNLLQVNSDASVYGLTVGRGAGAVSTNTAVGVSALAANTSGDQNTSVGQNSLSANTTGAGNSSFGRNSLVNSTTGSANTAFGLSALQANTTASNNTAVGYQAAYSNVTGANVTAIGYNSLYANTASNNTAVGVNSGVGNTTGSENTFVGRSAAQSNTTGSYNTALGYAALQANTTASNNTALGYQAGYSNLTATYNTLIGYQTGYSLTGNAGTGANTFIGNQAGYFVTSGTKNVIIGGYGGNAGGLDIRTASNYIVLSDGDGNPRGIFDGSGNLLVGTTATTGQHSIAGRTATDGTLFLSLAGTTGAQTAYFYYVNSGDPNAANTAIKVWQNSTTGRSINAKGTINASGADYAEYMTKASDFSLSKGDLVGIDANGKLTNVFADAVSFVVKSTNPSYVGGDTWGDEDAIGKRPDDNAPQAEKDAFNAALEAARQTVDRIAFAGQVPVNVMGATAGQFIVPVDENGSIKGIAVNEADMTLSQYMKAVGKVIAIEADGRAKIIVKVA